MKLSIEEKTRLIELSEKASNLLVAIMNEDLPESKKPTKRDVEFKRVLSQIYQICPLLSNSYVKMYNHIQEQKISSDNTYYKQIKNRRE